MERRQFLAAAGLAAVGATTGLASPVAADDGPQAVVRSYYREARDTELGSFRTFAADVETLSHSGSPLPEIAESTSSLHYNARRVTVADTRVVAEDVDPARFTDESSFLRASLSDSDRRAIAAENAVVEVRFESDPIVHRWLVATEGGEWRLVYFRATLSREPGEVVEEYYRRADAGTTDGAAGFAADVADLSHEVSPLPGVAGDTSALYYNARRATVLDVRVVAEDIDPGRVVGDSPYLGASLTDDQVATLAGQNAVVAARLDLGETEVVQGWFLATDDDGWGLVWPTDISGPGEVLREYYRRARPGSVGGPIGFADVVADLSHEVSPLPGVAEDTSALYYDARQATVRDVRVVAEDVDPERIVEDSAYLGAALTDDQVAALADRNAVAAATLELRGTTVDQGWFLATDDDGWGLVWVADPARFG